MSISIRRKPFPPNELVVLDHCEAVEIGEIQKTLTGLWRSASEDLQAGGGGTLALACLWNLVTYHSSPGGGGDEPARRFQQLVDEVTLSIPARVIHLEDWADQSASPDGREVEAHVGTHCIHLAGAGRMVCCENIHLSGYGDQGRFHFPALVRALLTSNLPVALLWLEDVPLRGRLLGQLLAMSDRMVVDSQHAADPNSLPALDGLMASAGGRVIDLGWLRLRPLRHLVAEFFDSPERTAQLRKVEGIRIESSPKGRNTGMMLAGWFLSRCGLGPAEAVDLGHEAGAWRWKIANGADTFPLDFSVREGYGGQDEIFLIEIRAGGEAFELRDVDPEHMSVKGPEREVASLALRESSDAELVAAALAGRAADPIYAKALEMAAHLVETQQWNQ